MLHERTAHCAGIIAGIVLAGLALPASALTLTVTPPAGGVIWGDPQYSSGKAIECGGGATKCQVTLSPGTIFILHQQAQDLYAFDKWTGDCASATGEACLLRMDASKTVGASLRSNSVRVSVDNLPNASLGVAYYDASKEKQGVPYGASILSCGQHPSGGQRRTQCSATIPKGTRIIAWTNTADYRWLWTSGFCNGRSAQPCNGNVNEDIHFSAKQYRQIDVAPPQNGKITFQGKTCPGDCAAKVDIATTSVAFQAVAAPGYILTNWGGDCASTRSDTCTITLKPSNSLSATFMK